jgi:hypothetical protein
MGAAGIDAYAISGAKARRSFNALARQLIGRTVGHRGRAVRFFAMAGFAALGFFSTVPFASLIAFLAGAFFVAFAVMACLLIRGFADAFAGDVPNIKLSVSRVYPFQHARRTQLTTTAFGTFPREFSPPKVREARIWRGDPTNEISMSRSAPPAHPGLAPNTTRVSHLARRPTTPAD